MNYFFIKKSRGAFRCLVFLILAIGVSASAQSPFPENYQKTPSPPFTKKPILTPNPPKANFINSVKKRIADGRKKFKKRKKTPLHLKEQKEKLILFQWLNEQQISLQWAGTNISQKDFVGFAPKLLKKEIHFDTFAYDRLFYLNFKQNIIQFPYILKWGLRASLAAAFNYDNEQKYFFPISISGVWSLQIFKYQALVPFFEMGFSTWNIDFYTEKFTYSFPFWSIGVSLSLALLKNSLRYTLPDEYGIKDIGIVMELRRHSSPLKWLNPWFDDSKKEWLWTEKNRGYFLTSFHAGIYCRF